MQSESQQELIRATPEHSRSDDRDRSSPVRGSKANCLSSTLVEGRELGTEVGGVTRVGGHLGEAT